MIWQHFFKTKQKQAGASKIFLNFFIIIIPNTYISHPNQIIDIMSCTVYMGNTPNQSQYSRMCSDGYHSLEECVA